MIKPNKSAYKVADHFVSGKLIGLLESNESGSLWFLRDPKARGLPPTEGQDMETKGVASWADKLILPWYENWKTPAWELL